MFVTVVFGHDGHKVRNMYSKAFGETWSLFCRIFIYSGRSWLELSPAKHGHSS